MQFDDVILGRRSIRGYKPDPVPRALIEEIIGLAMRAPSSMNTQPWNFYVITGEPLDRIRAGNTERMLAGVPQSREFRTGQAFAGQHRDRQVGVAKQLFSAMGIARDDKEMRQDWVLRGFRQFDAPVCVIVTYDRVLDGSDDTPFDCGAVATALVNAAWSRGLGAVINSQGIMQSPVVREHAGIAEDQVIMKSIALGWPDETFPANAVVLPNASPARRPYEPLGDAVTDASSAQFEAEVRLRTVAIGRQRAATVDAQPDAPHQERRDIARAGQEDLREPEDQDRRARRRPQDQQGQPQQGWSEQDRQ
jgi:nitroreductase